MLGAESGGGNVPRSGKLYVRNLLRIFGTAHIVTTLTGSA